MFQIKNLHIPFIPKMGWFVAVSAVGLVLSIFLIATKGLNFGTDFRGGTKLQYHFSAPVSESDVRQVVEALKVGSFSVQKIGTAQDNRVMIKMEKVEESQEFAKTFTGTLKAKLNVEVTLEQNESVGPKAGAELRKKALLAIIVSWVLMLIYIGYRFDFAFAPGGIIALIHDVTLAVGAFALTQREVSLAVVAAFLTIIGYSINDTIVIYDRVRENIKKHPRMAMRELVNLSLNECFSRTIITSFTVLMVVSLMYLFGDGEFQNFGFAMVVGVITGVFSTYSAAAPIFIKIKESQLAPKGSIQRKSA